MHLDSSSSYTIVHHQRHANSYSNSLTMCEYPTNSIPAGDSFRPNPTYLFNNETNSYSCWFAGAADAEDRVSPLAPSSDTVSSTRDDVILERRIKSEEMKRSAFKHVPHKERPPLIVAKRNARERRRVQAVNTAFMKLRKIVPIVNNRGKRISKVKTLQTAIDYISGLQALLKQGDIYHDLDIITDYRYTNDDFIHEFEDFEPEF